MGMCSLWGSAADSMFSYSCMAPSKPKMMWVPLGLKEVQTGLVGFVFFSGFPFVFSSPLIQPDLLKHHDELIQNIDIQRTL